MRMHVVASGLVWTMAATACGDDGSGDGGTGSSGGTASADTVDGASSESTAAAPGDDTSSSGTGGGTTDTGATGGTTEAEGSSSGSESTGEAFDPCAEIETTLFFSVEEQECGQGPMGKRMCNWTIRFDNMGGYHWEYSDTTEDGAVACEGEAIIGTPMAGGEPRMGTFDVATSTLTWEGVDYQ